MLSVVAIINDISYLFVLLYWPPGAIGDFIRLFLAELSSLPMNEHIVYILGDFNIDQRTANNPLVLLTDELNMTQLSTFTTHCNGGILDIILANNPAVIRFLPVYFSDHSILVMQL